MFITPGLPIKTTYDTIVRNNFVVDNNTRNFAIPGSIVAGIPAGTGILNMAGDQTTIEGNIITGNKTIGILITDHNVRETLGICGHAYILSGGKVIAAGDAEQILSNRQVREVYLGEDFRL